MTIYTNKPLKVEILKDTREFCALEEEWEELLQNAPLATPFQSWAWLYSWWEHYGGPYELELVTVRERDGLLVGILPLMLDRRWRFDRLLLLGTGLTDHLDVLVREGWEEAVARAGTQALGRIESWRVADLQQLRSNAAAWELFRWWPGLQARMWQDGFPVMEVRPWDELLASLSKNLRSTARRAVRRTKADQVHTELAKPEAAEQAARRLVALHRESRQGREISSEHLTERFEACIVAAVCRLIARNLGGISEFWRNGEVIISYFWVSKPGFFGTYILGASQETLRRYQWSSLYIWDAVNLANGKGISRLDLLRGEDEYKLRWNPEIMPNYRLILGKGLAYWCFYTGYYALHSKARRYAHSEEAPKWIKRVAARYRRVRGYLADRQIRGTAGGRRP